MGLLSPWLHCETPSKESTGQALWYFIRAPSPSWRSRYGSGREGSESPERRESALERLATPCARCSITRMSARASNGESARAARSISRTQAGSVARSMYGRGLRWYVHQSLRKARIPPTPPPLPRSDLAQRHPPNPPADPAQFVDTVRERRG